MFLSRAGRLVLIKSVLEAILVYCHLLAFVLKGILERIKKIYFNYLWRGIVEYKKLHLTGWKKISLPSKWGGWGLKYIHSFIQQSAHRMISVETH
jgi:hypothetical protein